MGTMTVKTKRGFAQNAGFLESTNVYCLVALRCDAQAFFLEDVIFKKLQGCEFTAKP